jgi:hypothetical protein
MYSLVSQIFKKYITILFAVVAIFIISHSPVYASTTDNIFGNAWSDNIGWISFNNCVSPGVASSCTGTSYGVKTVSGVISGYAWNDNVGWISFNPTDWGVCPPSGGCTNISTYSNTWSSGWARVLSMKNAGGNDGGADGWIHFSKSTSPTYGGTMGTANVAGSMGNLFSGAGTVVHSATGYWWGSNVLGWLDLNPTSSLDVNAGGVFDCVTCTAPPNGPTIILTPSQTTVLSGDTVDIAWAANPGTFIPTNCKGVIGTGAQGNTDWDSVNFGTTNPITGIHVTGASSANTTTYFSLECTDASSAVATSAPISITAVPLTSTLAYTGACMQLTSNPPTVDWSTNDPTASCRVEATPSSGSSYYIPSSGAYTLSGSSSGSGTSGSVQDTNYSSVNTSYRLSCRNGTGSYISSKLSSPPTSVNMCSPNYTITGSSMCQGAIGSAVSEVLGSNPLRYEGTVDLTLNPLYNFTSNASIGGTPSTGSLTFTPTSGFSYINSLYNTVEVKLTLTAAQYNTLLSNMVNNILEQMNITVTGSSQYTNPKTVSLNFCPAVTTNTCTIDSFYPSATNVITNDLVELHWATSNCTSASIDQGVGSVAPVSFGQTSVTVGSTTTYTMTATDGTNSDTASVTVITNPPGKFCKVLSFTGTPSTIYSGSTSDLEWTTSGCTSVQINGVLQSLNSGGSPMVVVPTTTTTYTLSASNLSSSYTAVVVVTVLPPPSGCAIDSFYASANTISNGQSSELNWATSNCISASIDQGVPAIGLNSGTSPQIVMPSVSTIYTLTATDGTTPVTAQVTVNVTDPILPFDCRINSFTPDPGVLVPPITSSKLSWNTVNCTNISIQNVASSLANIGDILVAPVSTTTYVLNADDGLKFETATATVTVPSSACRIDNFHADQSSVSYGASGVLNWQTTNCTSASISPSISTVVVPNTLGNGSTGPLFIDTVYTLTASDGTNTVTQDVPITVTFGAICSITSFSASPSSLPSGGGTTTLSWSTSPSCTSATLSGVGSVNTNGSTSATISSSTGYTLLASDANGSAISYIFVQVGSGGSATIKPKYKPF